MDLELYWREASALPSGRRTAGAESKVGERNAEAAGRDSPAFHAVEELALLSRARLHPRRQVQTGGRSFPCGGPRSASTSPALRPLPRPPPHPLRPASLAAASYLGWASSSPCENGADSCAKPRRGRRRALRPGRPGCKVCKRRLTRRARREQDADPSLPKGRW